MSALQSLAKILGLSRDDAEASMHSDRAARAVLSRRNLFAAGAALAAGSVFSFAKPEPEPAGFWVQNPSLRRATKTTMGKVEYWCEVRLGGLVLPGVVGIADRSWVVRTPAELRELVG